MYALFSGSKAFGVYIGLRVYVFASDLGLYAGFQGLYTAYVRKHGGGLED